MMVKWFKAALILPVFVFVMVSQAHAFSGQTGGLSPRLVKILHRIEGHFHSPLTVTSGCRSHGHNSRIGGARESWHLRCLAADVKVDRVGKGAVARFAASLGGRGGIGTYCHDSSIHVDLGPRREWYWGCGGQRSFSQGVIHRSTFHMHHLRRHAKKQRRHH
jgi:Peptidase M15